MTHFPILYHWGTEIDKKTVMQEGHFYDDGEKLLIKEKNGNFIRIDNVENTQAFTFQLLGAGVQASINSKTIVMIVPIIYLKIGNGIGLASMEKTIKLKEILLSKENAG